MMRSGSNKILDAICESRIVEATQGITVISYKAKGIKYGMQVVNTAGLNKLKKTPGFTEIDSYTLDKNDTPKRFYNEITDDLKAYGIDANGWEPNDNGSVTGKKDSLGYGYVIYDTSKLKIRKYGVND